MRDKPTDRSIDKRPFDFDKLESLRLFCKQILAHQFDSLEHFRSDLGFKHIEIQERDKTSVSSSATCILSLVATGKWKSEKAQSGRLLKYLLSREKSAGLEANNPFTTAWILEAVSALESCQPGLADSLDANVIAAKEALLEREITSSKDGGVRMKPYPPSGYLTQLVVRTLEHRQKLTEPLKEKVRGWSWAELSRQLALMQTRSKRQDAFSLAYLAMLTSAVTPGATLTPEQASTRRTAIEAFFRCQLEDGTWPLSQPLFHYPEFGNAHCYEYEMLTQLLPDVGLRDLLLEYLPNLKAVAEAVSTSMYRVDDRVMVWNSGHHPSQADPESWATASVYHFFHELDRFLADAVRRELFRYLELPAPRLNLNAKTSEAEFAFDTLDSELLVDGEKKPLKKFLWEKFVRPLAAEADIIGKGREFSKNTPRAAIFFGPPGTSKTVLSERVADFLGWPYLPIDPSRLLRKGLDGIQAEANTIFRMLEWTERVVVLFDEFDELVRERESSHADAFSRFLTTAMLPKLASIHKRGTLVFILATNNIGEFDLAIRRQGRFDHVVQIMPPTYEAKKNWGKWGDSKINIVSRLNELGVELTKTVKQQIADLTWGECHEFATELTGAPDPKSARDILRRRWTHCTLQMHISKGQVSKGDTTWKKRCKVEAAHSR
jgi:hypothetical protein